MLARPCRSRGTRCSDDSTRLCGRRVASVWCAHGLDEQDVRLLVGNGSMFDTFRDDEHLTRTERHIAIAQLDDEAAFEDEKEIVRVVVLVPNELTLDLR